MSSFTNWKAAQWYFDQEHLDWTKAAWTLSQVLLWVCSVAYPEITPLYSALMQAWLRFKNKKSAVTQIYPPSPVTIYSNNSFPNCQLLVMTSAAGTRNPSCEWRVEIEWQNNCDALTGGRGLNHTDLDSRWLNMTAVCVTAVEACTRDNRKSKKTRLYLQNDAACTWAVGVVTHTWTSARFATDKQDQCGPVATLSRAAS